MNEEMKQKNDSIKFPRTQPPGRVYWCWDISYECNYRCSYCRVDTWRKTRYISVDKWAKIWDKIYENYGSTHIRFSGGEPFIYPGFNELLVALGQKHTLNVTTNLSFDVNEAARALAPIADRARLVISSSYHPEHVKLQDFIDKVLRLKENGIYTSVSIVAWPLFMKEIPSVKKAMEEKDIQFQVIPLGGQFFNKYYPQGYTDEERELLSWLSVNVSNKASKDMFDFKVNEGDRKTKKRLCRMGMNFGMIRPNGDVFRCCTFDKRAYLGNMIDGTFSLLEKPAWCDLEQCFCYKAMIVGEEEKTERDWNWERHKTGLYSVEKKPTNEEIVAEYEEIKKRGKTLQVLLDNCDSDGAVKLLEQTMAEFPDNELPYLYLSEIYIRAGFFAEAKELLEKASKFTNSEWAKGFYFRLCGYLHASLGDIPAAFEYYAKSLKISEDDPYTWFHVAKTHMKTGNINGAVEAARKSVLLNPHITAAVDLLKDLEADIS